MNGTRRLWFSQLVFTGDAIQTGRQVWQSTGGQELGSVWGHGSYHAPDWSADWLHREAVFILNGWAQARGQSDFEALQADDKVLLSERLKREMPANTYDPRTSILTVPPERAAAIQANSDYNSSIFTGDPKMASLREAYAMKSETVKVPNAWPR
jgi:nitric oxide reductase subunit B